MSFINAQLRQEGDSDMAIKKAGSSPIDKSGNNREKIWTAIRMLKRFNIGNIADKTNIPQRTITTYLESLITAKIVAKETTFIKQKGSLRSTEYTLIADKGVDAPRVRKDGSFVPETCQTRMWKVIRVMQIFDLKTLIATASTEESVISATAADSYLKELKKAGYLIKKPQDKAYRLNPAMNFGPKAPLIQRTKQVYDPNIKKVVWSSGETQ